MNTKDYIALLNKPYSLNEKQTLQLEKILSEFPYLQSARAIYLKGLYNQDSFRYNTELKKTAAYTTDRSVLFDFITSENFQSIEKAHFDSAEKAIAEIIVNEIEEVRDDTDKLEASIKQTIQEAADDSEAEENITTVAPEAEKTEDNLKIGSPIAFTKDETHSFSEWLQLSKQAPVIREHETEKEEPKNVLDEKLDIIDRFIEANPKITPVKSASPAPVNTITDTAENSSLMTATLAKVYLEQKKYAKAIQAYEILILKYPEKSVFFADRINEIKIIQQNNN